MLKLFMGCGLAAALVVMILVLWPPRSARPAEARCPACGSRQSHVLGNRYELARDGASHYVRRFCLACGSRFEVRGRHASRRVA